MKYLKYIYFTYVFKLYPIKLSLWANGLLLLSMKDCLCMKGDRLLSMKLCLCMKGDRLSSSLSLMKFCRCMNGDLFISINCCLRMNGFLLTSAYLVIESIFSKKWFQTWLSLFFFKPKMWIFWENFLHSWKLFVSNLTQSRATRIREMFLRSKAT